jgi:Mg-chelatase subunit ChlD
MKRRSSDSQRGAVLAFFAFALLGLMLVAGLVVDLGVTYVSHGWLSRAVDAGALAGARHSSGTVAEIESIVRKVASANYNGLWPASYDVEITTSGDDTKRIAVIGRARTPALFSQLAGFDSFALSADAEATRYPLDMSLVIDVSSSLARNGVLGDVMQASARFVDQFDESADQLGLVTFATWAEERVAPTKNFKRPMNAAIRSLTAVSDSNIEEGLRLAKSQLDSLRVRENAVRVVVLFTDGRANAFADRFEMEPGNDPAFYDGVVAACATGSSHRGLFRASDGRKVVGFARGVEVTDVVHSKNGSPALRRLPDGSPVNGHNIRRLATLQAEQWAEDLRRTGYTIYTVALGNPGASHVLEQPDLDFLRRMSNHEASVDRRQPVGMTAYAPSVAELDQSFSRVADRVLTRLTR